MTAEAHGGNYGFENEQEDLVQAYNQIKAKNERVRLREIERLFHTFYENGTQHCRHQYARHLRRTLVEQ